MSPSMCPTMKAAPMEGVGTLRLLPDGTHTFAYIPLSSVQSTFNEYSKVELCTNSNNYKHCTCTIKLLTQLVPQLLLLQPVLLLLLLHQYLQVILSRPVLSVQHHFWQVIQGILVQLVLLTLYHSEPVSEQFHYMCIGIICIRTNFFFTFWLGGPRPPRPPLAMPL